MKRIKFIIFNKKTGKFQHQEEMKFFVIPGKEKPEGWEDIVIYLSINDGRWEEVEIRG